MLSNNLVKLDLFIYANFVYIVKRLKLGNTLKMIYSSYILME